MRLWPLLASGILSFYAARAVTARPMVLLFCKLCQTPFESHGGEIPFICPTCNRETKWTTSLKQNGPDMKWSHEDLRFLRSNRIAPD
jgi:hypothetical protein